MFDLLAVESGLGVEELYGTLNMGVGMIAVVGCDEAPTVVEEIRGAGVEAFTCGEIRAGSGRVILNRDG